MHHVECGKLWLHQLLNLTMCRSRHDEHSGYTGTWRVPVLMRSTVSRSVWYDAASSRNAMSRPRPPRVLRVGEDAEVRVCGDEAQHEEVLRDG